MNLSETTQVKKIEFKVPRTALVGKNLANNEKWDHPLNYLKNKKAYDKIARKYLIKIKG